MKLNLGSGDRYADGWINVDYGTPHQCDERIDLRDELPWHDVTHVYAGHVLEHLEIDDCLKMLTRLRGCMHPAGGLLMVVGPDVELAKQMIADGTFDATYHSLESLYEGAHRWSGDEHRWGCTGAMVEQLLRDAGWPVVQNLGMRGLAGMADAKFWPVADCDQMWQCVVRAYVGEPMPW